MSASATTMIGARTDDHRRPRATRWSRVHRAARAPVERSPRHRARAPRAPARHDDRSWPTTSPCTSSGGSAGSSGRWRRSREARSSSTGWPSARVSRAGWTSARLFPGGGDPPDARQPLDDGIGEVTRWPEAWAGRRGAPRAPGAGARGGKRIEGHTAGAGARSSPPRRGRRQRRTTSRSPPRRRSTARGTASR